MITVESLMESGDLHRASVENTETVKSYSRATTDHLLAGGKQPLEMQVTRLLSCTDGRLETIIIDYLLGVAGLDCTSKGLRLITGSQFNAETGGADHRSIDLVVRRRIGDEKTVPVLAAEAKYGAWVNGGFGYCPQNPNGYSNQAICYLHGCISDAHSTKVMSFVWLGHEAVQKAIFPWGRRGLTEKDAAEKRFAEGYAEQVKASRIWKTATWEGLAAAIRKGMDTEAGEAIARFLLRVPNVDTTVIPHTPDAEVPRVSPDKAK